MKNNFKASLNFRMLVILILLHVATVQSFELVKQEDKSSQDSGDALPKGYLVFKNGGFQHTLSKDNIYKLYLMLIFFMLGIFLLLFSIQFTYFLSLKMIKKMQLTDLLMKNKIIEPTHSEDGEPTYNPIIEVEEISIEQNQDEETTKLHRQSSQEEDLSVVHIDHCKENLLYTAVGRFSIVSSRSEKAIPQTLLKLIDEEKKPRLLRIEIIVERLSSIISKEWDRDYENCQVFENKIYLVDSSSKEPVSNLTADFSTVKEKCEQKTIKWTKDEMSTGVKELETIAYSSIVGKDIDEKYIDEETNQPAIEIVFPNNSEFVYFTLTAKNRNKQQLLKDSPSFDFDKMDFLKKNDIRISAICYVSKYLKF